MHECIHGLKHIACRGLLDKDMGYVRVCLCVCYIWLLGAGFIAELEQIVREHLVLAVLV